MDNRGEAWKALLVMTPLLAATLVAVSRIMDARQSEPGGPNLPDLIVSELRAPEARAWLLSATPKKSA